MDERMNAGIPPAVHSVPPAQEHVHAPPVLPMADDQQLLPPAVPFVPLEPAAQPGAIHAVTLDEKISAIKEMIDKHLPVVGFHLTCIGTPQFAAILETDSGKMVYKETRLKIQSVNESIIELGKVFKCMDDDPEESENFEFLKQELFDLVEKMRTTSCGFKKQIKLKFKTSALQRMKELVGIAERLLKDIRDYLDELLAKLESNGVRVGDADDFDGNGPENIREDDSDQSDDEEELRKRKRRTRGTSDEKRRKSSSERNKKPKTTKRSRPETEAFQSDEDTSSQSAGPSTSHVTATPDPQPVESQRNQRKLAPAPLSDSELLAKLESNGVRVDDGDELDGNDPENIQKDNSDHSDEEEELKKRKRRTSGTSDEKEGRKSSSKKSKTTDRSHSETEAFQCDKDTSSQSAGPSTSTSHVQDPQQVERQRNKRKMPPNFLSDSETEPEPRGRGRPRKNPTSKRPRRQRKTNAPKNTCARKKSMDSDLIKKRNRRTVCMFIEGVKNGKITEEVADRIAGIAGVEREVIPKLEVHIDQIAENADDKDYRGCGKWSSNLITPPPTPPPDNGTLEGFKTSNFTGQLHVDVKTVTSDDLITLVEESKRTRINQIFTPPSETVVFPKSDNQLYNDELKLYEEKYDYKGHEGLTGDARLQAPTTITTVTEGFDFNDPKFVKHTTERLSVIRGMLDVVGFDRSKFTISAILDAKSGVEVQISRQHPEPTDWNSDLITGEQLDVRANHDTRKVSFKEYAAYYTKALEIAKAGGEKMSAPKAKLEDLDEIARKLLNAQRPLIPGNRTYAQTVVWTLFAINLDLFGDEYLAQIDEIAKLMPSILSEHGLFSYTKMIIQGMISAQVYIKTPGSRTPAHVENGNFGSVNVNIGPGTCIWFVVAYEHAGKVAEIIERHGKENEQFWPLEKVCREAGIPIQTVHQLAGDVVCVPPGAYHWVISLGFAINVSWNVGQITNAQLQAAAIHNDRKLTHDQIDGQSFTYKDKEILVPLEQIVWAMARANEFGRDPAMAKTMKGIMIRSLARAEYEFSNLTEDEKKNIRDVPDDEKTMLLRCTTCDRILGNTWFSPRQLYYCFEHKPVRYVTCIREKIDDLREIFSNFPNAF